MLQETTEVRVHIEQHVLIASDVDVHRRHRGNRSDRVVGNDLVVDAERLDELDVAGRCQTDDLHTPAIEQKRRSNGGLGRCAGDDDLLGPEVVVVDDEIVDDEPGEEQREQQHLMGFAIGPVEGISSGALVAVVGAGKSVTMFGDVEQSAIGRAARRDHELGGHRHEPKDALAHGEIR